MALLVLFFAIYCVKNTTQDLIYAITGRVPPSFVREQRRMQFAREAMASRASSRALRQPVTADRGSRKFFRNAYNDAWETAEERRARWAAKRAEKRHSKWDAKDGVPAPIDTNARPEEPLTAPAAGAPSSGPKPTADATPKPVVHDDHSLVVGGKQETLYQRYAMRRRNGGQPMTAIAVADELDIPVVEAEKLQAGWAARYDQETDPGKPPQHLLEYQKRSRCLDCDGPIELKKNPDRPGNWIVSVKHTRDDCRQSPQRPTPREQHDQQVQDTLDAALNDVGTDPRKENEKDAAERETREQSLDGMYPDRRIKRSFDLDDPANWTPASQYNPNRSTDPSDTKENNDVTIETTGLQSGLAYNDAMAKTCEDGASSVEQSIAALENGEVGQSVTGPMQQGRELLEAAQACFRQAHDELQSHITIKEGYDANPDAGNKAFVTAE